MRRPSIDIITCEEGSVLLTIGGHPYVFHDGDDFKIDYKGKVKATQFQAE